MHLLCICLAIVMGPDDISIRLNTCTAVIKGTVSLYSPGRY